MPATQQLAIWDGGYYVSVKNDSQHALLLGPYRTHAEAISDVDYARKLAEINDPFSVFYAFGTCHIDGEALPEGKLNHYRGMCEICRDTKSWQTLWLGETNNKTPQRICAKCSGA